jgi:osmotically-inducible protein OsmY
VLPGAYSDLRLMKTPLVLPIAVAALLLLLQSGSLAAAEPAGVGDLHPQDATTSTSPANDSDDLGVTAQIRRALQSDESLSVGGKNIQILTNPDAVILRGAVRAQEPDRIEGEVQQYAGTRQVVNQLTVDDLYR